MKPSELDALLVAASGGDGRRCCDRSAVTRRPVTADLSALRGLLATATPGEWRAGNIETWHVFAPHAGIGNERVLLRMNEHFVHAADAALIAAARNALPGLLDFVDVVRAHIAACPQCRGKGTFVQACRVCNSDVVRPHECVYNTVRCMQCGSLRDALAALVAPRVGR